MAKDVTEHRYNIFKAGLLAPKRMSEPMVSQRHQTTALHPNPHSFDSPFNHSSLFPN